MTTTLAPEAMLQAGRKALGFRRYTEAIEQLEAYIAQADAQGVDSAAGHHSDYYQVKMWLVKAYQGAEQRDKALALCQELRETGNDMARIWADRYITTLAPEPEEPRTINQPDIPETPAVTLPQQTVVDFKAFCQAHLGKDLKDIEAMRQTVQKTIAVVTLIALLVIVGVVNVTASFYGATAAPKTTPYIPSQACQISGDPQSSECLVDRQRIAAKETPTYKRRQERRYQGERNKILLMSLMVLLGTLFCWVAFITSSIETYGRQFKVRIAEKVLRFLDPSEQLRYFRKNDGSGAIASFSHSMMAPKADRALLCQEKDYIEGTLGNTHMVFSQINVGVNKRSGLGMLDLTRYIDVFFLRVSPAGPLMVLFLLGLVIKLIRGLLMVISGPLRGKSIDFQFFESQVINQGPNIESIFKGIFFRAQFNKSVAARVTIVPNSLKNQLLPQRDWGKQVKLEDPMFGKLFTVYCHDQVAARYALSTALIDRLVTFARKANRPVYLSIVDDRIYVGLKDDREYLEPSLLHPMTHFAPLRDYFETLQLFLGIVDDLNLNQRIWMR